jgi:ligand-binding sensor domain-containing protein/class 3 adenylate cyclase
LKIQGLRGIVERVLTNRFRRVTAAAFFLCLIASPLSALDPAKAVTQYTQDAWTGESALPQATVQAIVQTRDGYLWLGTQEGLVRFDGVTFSPQNGVDTNGFAEASDGTLWMSTYSGLTSLKGGVFRRFTTAQGLCSDRVNALSLDASGALWLATTAGLNRMQGGRMTTFTTKDGLPTDEVVDVLCGRGDLVWLATRAGLVRYEQGRFTTYTRKDGLPTDDVSRLFQDSEGTLWIGTNGGGLCALRKGRFDVYGVRDGLASGEISALHEDRDGNLWVGTKSAGLVRMHGGKFEAYTVKEGLSENGVWSLFEDREGSLWVGTFGGGLNRLKDEKFTTYDTSVGLCNNTAWAVYEGSDQTLWIGTDTGLNALRDGKFTAYRTKDGLPNESIPTVIEDRDSALWVGTDGGGLARLKDGRMTVVGMAQGLSNPRVFCLAEDSRGGLWIGTNGGGLNLLKDGKITVLTKKDGLSDNYIRALLEDRQGNLWIGTNGGGLNRYRDGKFTVYTIKDGLAGDLVRALYEDREGNLWIGTRDGGLGRYRDGKFSAIRAKDGLFGDIVYQILEDGRRNLWMSCNRGVFRVAKQDLDDFAAGKIPAIRCVAYGKADGMKSPECNGGTQPAGCKSRDGRLWFPTIRGVVTVDPQRMRLNEVPPPVAVEAFRADEKPMALGAGLVVPAGTDRFEFRFTALSLQSPGKVRFRYFLEGHDRKWNELEGGRERVASYTNLPPGPYTFRVKACNNDGLWNEEGASLAFRLKPKFRQTPLFYALVILGILLLGGTLTHIAGIALENLRIGRSLTRYHSRQVIENLRASKGGEGIVLSSERRMITILFADLLGFSSFSDRREAEVVDRVINEYLTEMAALIEAQGGTVARFMGDGIMAFFGAPAQMEPQVQARRAVAAGVAMQEKMAELAQKWLASGLDHALKLRVGISQDYATVGNFGSKDLMEYTAIGSAVNLAARLETGCTPGHILVSFPVYMATKGEHAYHDPELREFKGFTHPVNVAELDLKAC